MGNLTEEKIENSDMVSGCVIASGDYPNEYRTGLPISIGKIDSKIVKFSILVLL